MAMAYLLRNEFHKKPPADMNMTTIESYLRKKFVTKLGVRALHNSDSIGIEKCSIKFVNDSVISLLGSMKFGAKKGVGGKKVLERLATQPGMNAFFQYSVTSSCISAKVSSF